MPILPGRPAGLASCPTKPGPDPGRTAMSLSWTTAAGWLLHCAVGGGLLLLLTCALMARTGQPVRRQRLGEWGLAAALALAVLSLGPRWLTFAYPAPAPAPPADAADPIQPRPDPDRLLAWDAGPELPDVLPAPAGAPPHPQLLADGRAFLPPVELAEATAEPWWQVLLAGVLPWLVAAYAL